MTTQIKPWNVDPARQFTFANVVVTGTLSVNGANITSSGGGGGSTVAFLAGFGSNVDANVAVNTTVMANTTSYNIGNCYNTSTCRFVAPAAGLYNFTLGVFFTASSGATQNMQVGIRKNGAFINGGSDAYATIIMQPGTFSTSVNQSVLTAQFLLAANDYIDVAPRANTLRHYQGHYWFQGYSITYL